MYDMLVFGGIKEVLGDVILLFFCNEEHAKLKQRGSEKKILPTVEGQKGGKWIVVDSGSLVIHVLDEKMRAYYNLDALWTEGRSMKLTSEESQAIRASIFGFKEMVDI